MTKSCYSRSYYQSLASWRVSCTLLILMSMITMMTCTGILYSNLKASQDALDETDPTVTHRLHVYTDDQRSAEPITSFGNELDLTRRYGVESVQRATCDDVYQINAYYPQCCFLVYGKVCCLQDLRCAFDVHRTHHGPTDTNEVISFGIVSGLTSIVDFFFRNDTTALVDFEERVTYADVYIIFDGRMLCLIAYGLIMYVTSTLTNSRSHQNAIMLAGGALFILTSIHFHKLFYIYIFMMCMAQTLLARETRVASGTTDTLGAALLQYLFLMLSATISVMWLSVVCFFTSIGIYSYYCRKNITTIEKVLAGIITLVTVCGTLDPEEYHGLGIFIQLIVTSAATVSGIPTQMSVWYCMMRQLARMHIITPDLVQDSVVVTYMLYIIGSCFRGILSADSRRSQKHDVNPMFNIFLAGVSVFDASVVVDLFGQTLLPYQVVSVLQTFGFVITIMRYPTNLFVVLVITIVGVYYRLMNPATSKADTHHKTIYKRVTESVAEVALQIEAVLDASKFDHKIVPHSLVHVISECRRDNHVCGSTMGTAFHLGRGTFGTIMHVLPRDKESNFYIQPFGSQQQFGPYKNVKTSTLDSMTLFSIPEILTSTRLAVAMDHPTARPPKLGERIAIMTMSDKESVKMSAGVVKSLPGLKQHVCYADYNSVPGDSGSPIIGEDGCIVGVHQGYDPTKHLNTFVQFNANQDVPSVFAPTSDRSSDNDDTESQASDESDTREHLISLLRKPIRDISREVVMTQIDEFASGYGLKMLSKDILEYVEDQLVASDQELKPTPAAFTRKEKQKAEPSVPTPQPSNENKPKLHEATVFTLTSPYDPSKDKDGHYYFGPVTEIPEAVTKCENFAAKLASFLATRPKDLVMVITGEQLRGFAKRNNIKVPFNASFYLFDHRAAGNEFFSTDNIRAIGKPTITKASPKTV